MRFLVVIPSLLLLLALTLTSQDVNGAAGIVETLKNAALIAKPLVKKASDVGATVAAEELQKASEKEKELLETEHRGGVGKQMLHKAVSLGLGAGTTYLTVVAPTSLVAKPLINLASDKLKRHLHKRINKYGVEEEVEVEEDKEEGEGEDTNHEKSDGSEDKKGGENNKEKDDKLDDEKGKEEDGGGSNKVVSGIKKLFNRDEGSKAEESEGKKNEKNGEDDKDDKDEKEKNSKNESGEKKDNAIVGGIKKLFGSDKEEGDKEENGDHKKEDDKDQDEKKDGVVVGGLKNLLGSDQDADKKNVNVESKDDKKDEKLKNEAVAGDDKEVKHEDKKGDHEETKDNVVVGGLKKLFGTEKKEDEPVNKVSEGHNEKKEADKEDKSDTDESHKKDDEKKSH